jgi:hypothetical protein
MNWLDEFKKTYLPLLNNEILKSGACQKRNCIDGLYDRGSGFQLMFELLFEKKNSNFQIIETGTVRNPNNWKDGNSGFLFSELVKMHGGFVRSVDINQTAVDTANQFIDQTYYRSFCSDSVTWLESLEDLNTVDLFYLDSWDVRWHDDHDSAEHHLKEFLAIESQLKPGAIVAIDDNSRLLDSGRRTGKGRRIVEYLEEKSILPIYDKYQIIYKF